MCDQPNLRSQLDAIERQLHQLTIKQLELAAESPASGPLPLLRSAEPQTRSRSPQTKDEYLMDLISHPINSRPVSATNRSLRNTPRAASAEINRGRVGAYDSGRRVVVYDDEEDEMSDVAHEDLSSRPSSGLQFLRGRYPAAPVTVTPRGGVWVPPKKPLSPVTAADYVEDDDESYDSSSAVTRDAHQFLWLFERKLIQEKKRLDQEFQAALSLMKSELQDARAKRQIDREEFLKQQHRLEKQSKEAKAEIKRLSDKLKRNEEDIKTAKMIAEDRVLEIERLETELTRTLARLSKSQGRHEELQVAAANLRQENVELGKKIEQLQEAHRAEISRLSSELDEKRSRLSRLEGELVASKQLVQKLGSEVEQLRVERTHDEALIVELSNSLDRVQGAAATERKDENLQLPETDDPSGTKSSSASSPQRGDLAKMQSRVDELEALYERAVRELEILRGVTDSSEGGKFVSLSRPSSRRSSKTRPRSSPLEAVDAVRRDDQNSILINYPFARSPTADSAPAFFLHTRKTPKVRRHNSDLILPAREKLQREVDRLNQEIRLALASTR